LWNWIFSFYYLKIHKYSNYKRSVYETNTLNMRYCNLSITLSARAWCMYFGHFWFRLLRLLSGKSFANNDAVNLYANRSLLVRRRFCVLRLSFQRDVSAGDISPTTTLTGYQTLVRYNSPRLQCFPTFLFWWPTPRHH